ncbi:MAG: DUF6325 family protein [Candidatus Limnocylindrales bacterium]
MELGPVEYMVVAFPGNQFRGEIAPALRGLVDQGLIRIIDLAFVGKDGDGETVTFELSELAPDVQAAFSQLGIEGSGLMNQDDLQSTADGLEPNSSAALLVWEDLWAKKLAQSMRDAGGLLVDRQLVPHDVAQDAHDYLLAIASGKEI